MSIEDYKKFAEEIKSYDFNLPPELLPSAYIKALNMYINLLNVFVQDVAAGDQGLYYANKVKIKANILFELQGIFLK